MPHPGRTAYEPPGQKLPYIHTYIVPFKAILAIKKDWFLRTKSIMILLLISGIFTLCSALFQYLYQTESDDAFQETLRRVFLSFSFLQEDRFLKYPQN